MQYQGICSMFIAYSVRKYVGRERKFWFSSGSWACACVRAVIQSKFHTIKSNKRMLRDTSLLFHILFVSFYSWLVWKRGKKFRSNLKSQVIAGKYFIFHIHLPFSMNENFSKNLLYQIPAGFQFVNCEKE